MQHNCHPCCCSNKSNHLFTEFFHFSSLLDVPPLSSTSLSVLTVWRREQNQTKRHTKLVCLENEKWVTSTLPDFWSNVNEMIHKTAWMIPHQPQIHKSHKLCFRNNNDKTHSMNDPFKGDAKLKFSGLQWNQKILEMILRVFCHLHSPDC